MSFWSAWWRRRAAGVPDTARPAHGRADGDDRSGATGRQTAPEAVQDAATPQDGIAVELRGLAMRFGAVEALRGLDARIPAGRITGLVGPDGAGKTTLLRLLAGLMEPAAGQALLFGRPAREVAADAPNSIGYMPQRFGLYEDLSVMANLRLHARLRGLEGEARDALFDRLLAFTSLGPFTRRLAGRLSGGMKQKLGIACALLGAPRVLLLDEPGVGVDPLSRQELWQMVSELSDDGMTVIWSTAYLDEAARCPGIIMLDGGRILYDGPPEGLTARVEGRVFHVSPGSEGSKAALARWTRTPGVEDALMQGSRIRVLLGRDAPESTRAAVREAGGENVPARLEDAYMHTVGGLNQEPSPYGRTGGESGGHVSQLSVEAPERIVAKELTKRFGDFTAADHISFTVRAGAAGMRDGKADRKDGVCNGRPGEGILMQERLSRRLWVRQLLALVGKEFQQIVRDPSSYLVAGVLPLLFLLLFGYGITLDAGVLQLAVFNQSGGQHSRALLTDFAHSPHFVIRSISHMREGERLMRESSVQGILVLGQQFDAQLDRGTTADVQLIVDGTEPNVARFIQSYAQAVLLRWQEARQAGGVPQAGPVSIEERYWYNPTAKSERFLVPGAITVIMTLIGTLLTSLVFAREWERGTMEAMLATPVSRWQMLLGKLIPYYCMGMFSMGLCAPAAVTLFGVPYRGSVGALLFISSVFMLCALGQGLLISVSLHSQLQAAEAGLFSGFLPALLLSGFVFDINSMPPVLQAITHLVPARYFNTCLRTLFLTGDVWELFWPCLGAMSLLALLMLGLVYKKLVKRLDV